MPQNELPEVSSNHNVGDVAKSLIITAKSPKEETTSVKPVKQKAVQPVEEAVQEEFDLGDAPTGDELVEDDATDDVYLSDDEDEYEDAEDGSEDEDEDEQDDTDGLDLSDDDIDVGPDLNLSDDDVIPVLIDGETKEFTVGQLAQVAAKQEEVEKLHTEAHTHYTETFSTRNAALDGLRNYQEDVGTAIRQVEDILFRQTAVMPDRSMRTSDPDQYYRLRDAHEADKERVDTVKRDLQAALVKARTAREQQLEQYAADTEQVVLKTIPVLADPKKGGKVFAAMQKTAQEYGYTEQEIGDALDPRMYKLVYDVMVAKNSRKARAGRLEDRKKTMTETATKKKVRRLRAAPASQISQATRMAQQDKQKVDRARKTGDLRDIAQSIITTKPRSNRAG